MDKSLLVPLVGILGIVIGAVLNGVYSRWNERVKWEREQDVRHSDQRLAAYIELFEVGKSISSHPDPNFTGDQDRLTKALLTIDMIATIPVRKAAEEFLEMIYGIQKMKSHPGWEITDSYKLKIMEAHDQFVKAIRKERGIRDPVGRAILKSGSPKIKL